LKGKWVLSTIC